MKYSVFVFILSAFVFSGCQNLNIVIPGTSNSGASNSLPPCPSGPLTCIFLTWNASTSSGVNYHIWWGSSSGNYTNKANAGTGLSYQLTNMAPGTYYIAATAYDGSGESGYSNEVSPQIPIPLITARELVEKRHEKYLGEKAVTIGPKTQKVEPAPKTDPQVKEIYKEMLNADIKDIQI